MKKRTEKLLQWIPLEILITAIVFLLSLFAFSFIVHEAVLEQEDIFDQSVIHFFSTHASPGLISFMEHFTFFGSTTFLLPAYLVLIIWLIQQKKTAYAIDTAVLGITSTALMMVLKNIFQRHRPALPVIRAVSGYSFPSGHSLSSFVFSSILIYLVWKSNMKPGLKNILLLLLILYPLLIGLSRIVLNVHYATDVIGGFCAAIVWVILSFVITQKLRKQQGVNNSGVA
ncbi:MAG: phosphatase PAP2 family protein [Chitinophagaceae bacterium]